MLQDYVRFVQWVYQLQLQIGVVVSVVCVIVEGDVVVFFGFDNFVCWLVDLDVDVMYVDGFGVLYCGFWKVFSMISVQLFVLFMFVVIVGYSEGVVLVILFVVVFCVVGRLLWVVYGFELLCVSIDGMFGVLLIVYGV